MTRDANGYSNYYPTYEELKAIAMPIAQKAAADWVASINRYSNPFGASDVSGDLAAIIAECLTESLSNDYHTGVTQATEVRGYL